VCTALTAMFVSARIKRRIKTIWRASIIPGGKKSINAGYYIQVQPGGESFIGGGRYMVEPLELKKIRQEIDYSWDEFNKIIHNKKFVACYGELERGEGMALEPRTERL
jgi:uncharacterized protein (DUF2461 family)